MQRQYLTVEQALQVFSLKNDSKCSYCLTHIPSNCLYDYVELLDENLGKSHLCQQCLTEILNNQEEET